MGNHPRGKRTVNRMNAARAAAAIFISGLLSIAAAPAALAHDELESSSPADGASLTSAPARITFTFGAAPLPDTTKIVAAAEDGSQVPLSAPDVKGKVATTPWPVGTHGGKYTVSWRNVGSDGHPITGSITFSYTAGTASPSPAATPPVTPSATATASASASPVAASSTETPWLPWTIAGVVVIVIAGGAAAVVIKRRNT